MIVAALALAAAATLPVHVGGRVAPQPDGSIAFGWPAIYLEGRFTGPAVEATVESGTEFMRLLVDGEPRATLTRPGRATIRIDGLAPGEHVVRLEKLTESQTGGGRFLGFSAPGGTSLPARPRRRAIEFIGDSYTIHKRSAQQA